jgi:hypothetical protein
MIPKTEEALREALQDLEIRSVVQETVRSMLVDVELACSLEKELAAEQEKIYTQKRILAADLALQEARLVQEQQQEEKQCLADDLVKELWALSKELGKLKRWKKENEGTIQERDELLAKLLQAEEKIEALRSQPSAQPQVIHQASSSRPDSRETAKNELVASSLPKEPAEALAGQTSSSPFEAPPTDSGESQKISKLQGRVSDGAGAASTEETLTRVSASDEVHTKLADKEAVVALDEEGEEEPLLETFEEPILLNIFAYLEALEIVNLAQVNIALYSRVDSLFGIGDQSKTPVPKEIHVDPAPPRQATIVQLPPPPEEQKKLPPPPAGTASIGGGSLISLFQTSRPHLSNASTPPKIKASSSRDKTSSGASKQQPLSAAMANSMAEKLTDKEINAIISMTEKLNQRNKEVDALTKENMELQGKLDGTGAVKEFLVNKVREIEQTLAKSKDVEIKTAQQISSDQEVIAFLDSRVQELEHSEGTLRAEKKSISDKLIQVQVQNDKKITVLSDMLQYERERLAENEREWKATRKVLVKEVKSCRAQILALQAENEGLKEQNDLLKKAVLAAGAMNGTSSALRD